VKEKREKRTRRAAVLWARWKSSRPENKKKMEVKYHQKVRTRTTDDGD